MSSEILRLDCDNLVIGAGLAGLVAALRLTGTTIVASAGMGATAISGGVLSSPCRDPDVDQWFLSTMKASDCRYTEGRCLTDLMAAKAGMIQESMDFGEEQPVPVSLDGTTPAQGMALDIPRFRGRSCTEIARILDTDDTAVDLLSAALKNVEASAILLPPVLGITRASEVRSSVENNSGTRVFEYVTAPSIHGMRLLGALRKLAGSRKAITVLDMSRVDRIKGAIRGRMGTKGKREFTVSASKLILATGGPLTGLKVDGDRVIEPLTGHVVGDVSSDFDFRFLADHPIMYRGIGQKPGVSATCKDVRAAGAVSVGYGLYEALRTGYYAGAL
ncbi:FAD-dependent oxidoreductase [Methanocella arvoryzae]|uniref:Predicted fumarate reductase/succinate dehydrogenase component n=1 Tax=Methanocella arvoryzae (strain DSM 22066 / NBRC 105507 / MRE50) TaxID=351160 RepID=Q0W8T1_METAR|nr:FAD-dependent oxidoreductase [Methanocella arvoryzae]CAJ35212.1 predicted fumarate reductase/succinate dehydrogenase component [Methanocella arvoryzae MRE50]